MVLIRALTPSGRHNCLPNVNDQVVFAMLSACACLQAAEGSATAADRPAKPVRMRAGFQPWAPRASRPAAAPNEDPFALAAATAAAERALSGKHLHMYHKTCRKLRHPINVLELLVAPPGLLVLPKIDHRVLARTGKGTVLIFA